MTNDPNSGWPQMPPRPPAPPAGNPSAGSGQPQTPAPPPVVNPWDRSGSWSAPQAWGAPPPVQPGPYGGFPGAAGPSSGGYPRGYRPPPKPGLIPLRPLGLGEILDGGFQAIRRNFRVMIGFPAIVLGIMALIGIGLAALAFLGFGRQIFNSAISDDASLGFNVVSQLANLVTSLFSSLGAQFVSGLLILYLSRAVLGQKLTVGELWQRLKPRVWRLIGLTALLSVGLLVGLVVLLLPALFLGISGSSTGAIVAAVAAYLIWVVAAFYFGIRFALASCALVLEEAGILTALRRSWRLTGRGFWRFTGIYILTLVIASLVTGIISTPVVAVLAIGAGAAIFGFQDSPSVAITVGVVAAVLGAIVLTLTSAVSYAYTASTTALLYFDQRMRQEGLDIQLIAEADALAASGRP